MPSFPIPAAAFSYIETDTLEFADDPEGHGLDADETRAVQLLASHVEGQRLHIPENPADAVFMAEYLNDLSNYFDNIIELGRSDNPKFDSAARRAFATLASKVRAR